MQVVAKVAKVEGVVGILTLDRLGYSWRIKKRINGKMQTVAQSFYYTTDKQKAFKTLVENYDIIIGFTCDLFNYKMKERESNENE